jgi:hypothetical protein
MCFALAGLRRSMTSHRLADLSIGEPYRLAWKYSLVAGTCSRYSVAEIRQARFDRSTQGCHLRLLHHNPQTMRSEIGNALIRPIGHRAIRTQGGKATYSTVADFSFLVRALSGTWCGTRASEGNGMMTQPGLRLIGQE